MTVEVKYVHSKLLFPSLGIMILSIFLFTTFFGLARPHGVTIGISPHSHPVLSQYHAQDALGQHSYGYATPTATKTESKSVDGVTQGGYSYIDPEGHLQSVSYIADPVHGFRVAASNLPQDLPDVALAKAAHLAQFAAIKQQHALGIGPVDLPEVLRARQEHLALVQKARLPQVVQDLPEVIKARAEHLAAVERIKARDAAINLSPVHLHQGHIVPIHYPLFVAANAAPTLQPSPLPTLHYQPLPAASHSYHTRDGWGQYSYGYVGPLSAQSEIKSADGVTRGGYSYIDANGLLQSVHYVADDTNGFRVLGTNIPH